MHLLTICRQQVNFAPRNQSSISQETTTICPYLHTAHCTMLLKRAVSFPHKCKNYIKSAPELSTFVLKKAPRPRASATSTRTEMEATCTLLDGDRATEVRRGRGASRRAWKEGMAAVLGMREGAEGAWRGRRQRWAGEVARAPSHRWPSMEGGCGQGTRRGQRARARRAVGWGRRRGEGTASAARHGGRARRQARTWY